MTKRKFAFKGFDKDLVCRTTQFEIGKEYSKAISRLPLRTCSPDGFHYCNKFEKVLGYYGYNQNNRYCKIEILGEFTDDNDGKSITNHFRIIKEYSKDVLKRYFHIKEIKRLEKVTEDNIKLKLVKNIQTKYPNSIIGGSVALFLHGIRLKRFSQTSVGDLDITLPYFELFQSDKDFKVEESNDYSSGNDFESVLIINNTKTDIMIDPKAKYEIVTYKGEAYKVAKLETIMEAKWRYALRGNSKHKEDCYEMIGKTKKEDNSINLPF